MLIAQVTCSLGHFLHVTRPCASRASEVAISPPSTSFKSPLPLKHIHKGHPRKTLGPALDPHSNPEPSLSISVHKPLSMLNHPCFLLSTFSLQLPFSVWTHLFMDSFIPKRSVKLQQGTQSPVKCQE